MLLREVKTSSVPKGGGEVFVSTESTALLFCGGKMPIPARASCGSSIQRTWMAPSQGGFSPESSPGTPWIHEEQAGPPGQAPLRKGGSSPSHSPDLLQAHKAGHSPSLGKTRWEFPGLESPQAALGSSPRIAGSSTDPRATTAPPRCPSLPAGPEGSAPLSGASLSIFHLQSPTQIQDFTFSSLRGNTGTSLGTPDLDSSVLAPSASHLR